MDWCCLGGFHNIKSAFLVKALITLKILFQLCESKMCEFNVILNGKVEMSDVIYAKADGNGVLVKNIMGESKQFKDCKIVEVDVTTTRLVLVAF
jgi:predicted RNA-binding protein